MRPPLTSRSQSSCQGRLARLVWRVLLLGFSLLVGLRREPIRAQPAPDLILSIVGTNDLHGRVFASRGRGGLALLAGFLNNVRAARAADGGAVILLDAGDTFQGGIESNLSEGALVVDAYNALGYTAAAVGNHEFDFGAVDEPTDPPARLPDPRGALKALAARARYPFLAANLLDATSGQRVDWPNVRPSTLVEVAGIKVGVVGVMTFEALRATLSANVGGLRVAPLAQTIEAEAKALRERGATVVLVTAHAGGRCTKWDSPTDVSSCDPASEIFQVARLLPEGLVDAIVAGHTHAGLAHQVAGIPIVESLSLGQAFSRVDLTIDRQTKRVAGARPFPPQEVCAYETTDTHDCAPDDEATPLAPAHYEGRVVSPDFAIVRAMEPGLAQVRARQAVPLGVILDTLVGRQGDLESPLGTLFARAIHESIPGVDLVVNNTNAIGGLRADLAEGPLTFGRLYDVFPFDDRLVRLDVTGAQLRAIFAADVRRARRGALGVSGVRIRATCTSQGLSIDLARASGAPIHDGDRLALVTTDLMARGTVFSSLAGDERFDVPASAPIAREVVAAWLRRRGGRLSAAEFSNPATAHWHPFDLEVSRCAVPSAETR